MALPPPDSHPPDLGTKTPNKRMIILLAGVLGLGACLVVLVAGGILLAPRLLPGLARLAAVQPSPQVAPLAQITPTPASLLAPTEEPTATRPLPTPTEPPAATLAPTSTSASPTATLEPAAPPPDAGPPSGGPGSFASVLFEDDFSSTAFDWPVESDDISDIGYFEGGTYAITMKVPEYYTWVFPPLDFPPESDWTDIYTSFSARLLSEDGYFGVFCRFQDGDNNYEVAIRDGAYSIGKWVGGEYTPLTSPEWVDTPYTGAEYAQGFPYFTVGCIGDTISLEINGYGVDPITDSTYSQGSLAVFAFGGNTPDPDEGFYARLLLDSFSASLP
jgi:hypothetical protein